jgi:hypothetical protein
VGKNISVITDKPLSANNSTEASSIINIKSVFSFLVKRGAKCFPAKPFSKFTLPD